jgi:pimeloyl-ACP methyl ester carboxylesterase
MGLFCLVHGSTQTAEGWSLLVRELDKRGHRTVCTSLPNDPDASGTQYATVIANSLAHTKEAPIVVAHSASGLFLPLVAEQCPVSRLVFLAAIIPQVGRSFLEQIRDNPDMLWPDWIGKDPTKDHETAVHFLFHDCSPEITKWALTTLRLMYARRALAEIFPLERWPELPSSYILCREDRTVRPEWLRRAAWERLGINAIELPGGHCPHVSRPEDLAEVLARLE